VLHEHRFRDHGTRAAGTGQSGDGRQQMQKKNGQIAHSTILARSLCHKKILSNLGIRHAHAE
jgi:hypothetical protein